MIEEIHKGGIIIMDCGVKVELRRLRKTRLERVDK